MITSPLEVDPEGRVTPLNTHHRNPVIFALDDRQSRFVLAPTTGNAAVDEEGVELATVNRLMDVMVEYVSLKHAVQDNINLIEEVEIFQEECWEASTARSQPDVHPEHEGGRPEGDASSPAPASSSGVASLSSPMHHKASNCTSSRSSSNPRPGRHADGMREVWLP